MNTIDAGLAGQHLLSYERGGPMRRYMIFYGLAVLSVAALWGGVGGVLIPLQVQHIDFAQFFAGAMASVNLQELFALKARIAAGAATATDAQQRLLDVLAAYEAARASHLATIKAVAVAVTMVMQPLVGLASDRTRSRWGRRAPWVAAGALAMLAGLVWMKQAGGIAQLLAGWILAQAGITMVLGPLGATVVDRMPAGLRGAMSAVAGAGMVLGFIVGISIAGALVGPFGLESYLIFAAVAVTLSLCFLVASPDRPSSAMPLKAMRLASHLLSCTHALRDKDFRWVWGARVLLMFAYACAATYTVYMLQSYIQPGLSATDAAKTVGLLNLAALPGTLLAMVVTGRWSDKLMRRRPFVVAASVLLAVSMAIPLVWPALGALYVQHVLGGLAFGTFLAVDQALLIDVLPSKDDSAGRDLGLGQFAANLGSLMGPILAGVVLSASGGYRLIWLAGTVLALAAAVALMPVSRNR